jgi:murein DD-endopeptidase MepM/ murein hydrolase activator NlpD
VDYAAPTGTPIKAAGDGRVRSVGWQGGYGKTIVIDHGNTYSTLYGHLSRTAKSLKSGQTVRQGQVIGYVGRTGLATGPHLHYEFRVNGVHQNPLTVKLPESTPLEDRRLVEFKKESNAMFAQLEMLTGTHARGLGSESNVVKSRVIQ